LSSPARTILPPSPPSASRLSRAGRPLLFAVLGLAVVAGTLATAAFFTGHRRSSPTVPTGAQSQQTAVSEAQFRAAANTVCDHDYAAVVPEARANASNPMVLINLSISTARKLSQDVVAVAHPATDDESLATIGRTSDALAAFMEQNKTQLANPSAPSQALLSQAAADVTQMKTAYLQLGLTQCVKPQLAGPTG
jgi:hypothetical protein